MEGGIIPYQGGLPYLYTRGGRQRGGGFFSSLKRFLIPMGRAVLPSLVRGVEDVMSGLPVVDTLKKRGLEAGKSALICVRKREAKRAQEEEEEEEGVEAPPPKKYKRGSPRTRASVFSRRRNQQQQQSSDWQ